MTRTDDTRQEFMDKIERSLNTFADSYADVTMTFKSIVDDVEKLRRGHEELTQRVTLVEGRYYDAIAEARTGADLWRSNAIVQRDQAAEFKRQLEEALDQLDDIEEIELSITPVPMVKRVKRNE